MDRTMNACHLGSCPFIRFWPVSTTTYRGTIISYVAVWALAILIYGRDPRRFDRIRSEIMILPVWIQDTEQKCCGHEIKVGQFVEWMIYAYLDAIPETQPEVPQISVVSNDEVEIVGDWIPQPQWPEEVTVFGAFGDLHHGPVHVGLAIRQGAPVQESLVAFHGKLWHEWHTERKNPPMKGVIRSLYYHRERLEQTDHPGGWKHIGFYEGQSIRAMTDIDPRDNRNWAIRCLLEITG